jgi:hypothetical protein
MGVAESSPWPRGWSGHPQKATKKKKKKKKVLAYGGGSATPIPTGLGVAEPPPCQGGGPATPKRPPKKNKEKGFGLYGCPREWFGHLYILSFFFFFFFVIFLFLDLIFKNIYFNELKCTILTYTNGS